MEFLFIGFVFYLPHSNSTILFNKNETTWVIKMDFELMECFKPRARLLRSDGGLCGGEGGPGGGAAAQGGA